MSKSKGHWKGATIILLVILIAMIGIGTIIINSQNQRINDLENILKNNRDELSQTQSELSQTRKMLDFSQRMLELAGENSSSIENLIDDYEAISLRNPTYEELSDFLLEDDSNEGNYTTFTDWIELNLRVKENANENNIWTGLVTIEYNSEYEGELREGGWTLVLVAELDDGDTVYFSPANDEIYYELEQLLNDWEYISNSEVVEKRIYW